MDTLKELFRTFAYWTYRVLPKFNYAIVYGWPDFEDTSLALQEGLNKSKVKKVIFFVCGNETQTAFKLEPKTKIVRKNTVAGLFYFLFARYVFFTHRCFMFRFPPNVVSVNVWHGMPIKRIGWMLEGNRGIDSKYSVATSDFWAEIVQKSLRPFDGTFPSGHPRNDRLLSKTNDVWNRIKSGQNNFSKAIAWLPTYRKSVRGEIRSDGEESGNMFGMAGISAESLNEFLKQNNAVAFVKPHPMAPFEKVIELSNLLIVDDQWLRSRGVTLYELLGQCDVLVTDISSVVVDYLLLNRPVVHSMSDLQSYGASRGYSINPVTDYLVGSVATNVEELFEQLSRIFKGEDSHAAQRERIQKLFHRDIDFDSTKRLLDQLDLIAR